MSPTADPEVASSILARSHTFVEVDCEIITNVMLLLPLIHRSIDKPKIGHDIVNVFLSINLNICRASDFIQDDPWSKKLVGHFLKRM